MNHLPYMRDDATVQCNRCKRSWPLAFDHVAGAEECGPTVKPWPFAVVLLFYCAVMLLPVVGVIALVLSAQ